jgi:hypothetical protein
MRDLFRQGQRIPLVNALNMIAPETLRAIHPGPGINIVSTGDGISISTKIDNGANNKQMRDPFFWALVASLDEGGDLINVYTWDYANNDWFATTTTVYKPYYLMLTSWDGQTITYTDGREVTYSSTSLEPKYQRRATWTEDAIEYDEVQDITAPYAVGEQILCAQLAACTGIRGALGEGELEMGLLMDMNIAGRHWAVVG